MNQFQKIFDAQKALFATGVTRTYEWRVDQLDRMARMVRENEERFQRAMAKEFKTASPTLTSFATTHPARSRAWIAIGTTLPSTPSWRALCSEIPSKDGIGQ